jgi:hypothetical protein
LTSFPLILREGGDGESRFTIVPADCLLDLPVFPNPPDNIPRLDVTAGADFLKSTYQSERRQACQDERKHFVEVCRDYLQKSFSGRVCKACCCANNEAGCDPRAGNGQGVS